MNYKAHPPDVLLSLSEAIRKKAAAAKETLKNGNAAGSFYPSSALVIKAITTQPQLLGEHEQPEEILNEGYDDWVYQAFLDLARKPQRFHTCTNNTALIECPRERLLRLGMEAEIESKPSKLFRYLMELTDNGRALPHVTERALSTAQKYLNIAIAFKQFAAGCDREGANFKDMKCEFRRTRDAARIHVSESTLERALRMHDLDWSAYAIDAQRKGMRK
jgi:hypothetical protein